MKMSPVIALLSVVVLAVLSGCGRETLQFGTDPAVAPKLTLDAKLWRDFMPGPQDIESGGIKRLMISVEIKAPELKQFPLYLNADCVWVWNRETEELWEAPLLNVSQTPSGSHVNMRIGRDGPLWDPGTAVDVTVRIYNKDSHDVTFVKADKFSIGATR